MPFLILNKYKMPASLDGILVIDVMRPNLLQNPHRIQGEDTRDVVIKKFRRDLWELLKDPASAVCREVERLAALHLEGVTIGFKCCCAPQACHAESLRDACLWVAHGRIPVGATHLTAESIAALLNFEAGTQVSPLRVLPLATELGILPKEVFENGRAGRQYPVDKIPALRAVWVAEQTAQSGQSRLL